VNFPENVIKALDNAPPGSVKLMHNHPLNSPPSWPDLMFLCLSSVSEVQVVGSDGRVYTISIASGIQPESVAGFSEHAKELEKTITRDIVQPALAEGKIGIDETELLLATEVFFQISREYKWDVKGGKLDAF
jgi:hypothetical protein